MIEIEKKDKRELISAFQQHERDTGSCEVQIALLTKRIKSLTEHLRKHKKDVHSRYGLIKMVSRRKKLLRYLKKSNYRKYKDLIKNLEIREV